MATTENTQESINIEYEIAIFINSIYGNFIYEKHSQKNLHEAICHIDSEVLTPEERKSVKEFLKLLLSFSFICKDYPKKIQEYIDYHDSIYF